MGAWQEGAFSNDDAMDFLDTLRENKTKDLSFTLTSTMNEVCSSHDYVELPEMNNAIVAAALVSITKNPSLKPIDLDLANIQNRLSASSNLERLAIKTFRRAFEPENNEWLELWDEANGLDVMRGSLEPYIKALDK
jgi:hypothetical protein